MLVRLSCVRKAAVVDDIRLGGLKSFNEWSYYIMRRQAFIKGN
jgi:hypothetical protein